MLNVTYLAVLEPEEDGSYSIFFPDLPGCSSYGKDLDEAQRMATEAASLHVYGMECDHEEIPVPSVNLSREDTEGNICATTNLAVKDGKIVTKQVNWRNYQNMTYETTGLDNPELISLTIRR